MIRRPTVVYIIVLLAVAGIYLFLRTRERLPGTAVTPEATTQEVSYLFTAEGGSPTAILLQAKSGETVELARDAESAWVLKRPVESAAEQGESEAPASQVATIRILERIAKIDPEVVGLQAPAYVLAVKFNNGTERRVHIGVVTPTESGYYVQKMKRKV